MGPELTNTWLGRGMDGKNTPEELEICQPRECIWGRVGSSKEHMLSRTPTPPLTLTMWSSGLPITVPLLPPEIASHRSDCDPDAVYLHIVMYSIPLGMSPKLGQSESFPGIFQLGSKGGKAFVSVTELKVFSLKVVDSYLPWHWEKVYLQ